MSDLRKDTVKIYVLGPYQFDLYARALLRDGRAVAITPKGLETLEYFVSSPGKAVGRAELRHAVWRDTAVSDNSVDQKISEIRRVLPDLAQYIENQPGIGWRYTGPVFVESPARPEPKPLKREGPISPPAQEASTRRTARRFHLAFALILVGTLAVVAMLLQVSLPTNPAPRVVRFEQLTFDGREKRGPVVTYGDRVYFQEVIDYRAIAGDTDSRSSVTATVQIQGGDVEFPGGILAMASPLHRVFHTGQMLLAGRFPKFPGRTLALWHPGGSWRKDLTGSADELAGVSHDGRWLASPTPGGLRIAQIDGTTAITIPIPGHIAQEIEWSPDGTRIRFSLLEYSSEHTSLWEAGRDGRNLHRFQVDTGSTIGSCCGKWTPDGRYFIFVRTEPESALLAVREGTVAPRPTELTNAPLTVGGFSPSIDGSKLFAIMGQARGELVRFDSSSRRFVSFWDGTAAVEVSFSRDGRRAAFCRHPDFTLWVSDALGKQQRQLTRPPLEVHQPHWSPNGETVAFMGRMPGKPWKVYLADLRDTTVREVMPEVQSDQGVPSWSGDGRSLVFGERLFRRPKDEMAIRVLDLENRRERILPGSKGKWTPRWSPDGRWIVAQTPDFRSLFLFDCASQNWTLLVDGMPDLNDPVWSLDSKYVHFRALSYPQPSLFRVPVTGGRPQRIAPYPECYYHWAGVTPEGEPIVLRSVRTSEVYALHWILP